jgi:hypothetical protein
MASRGVIGWQRVLLRLALLKAIRAGKLVCLFVFIPRQK